MALKLTKYKNARVRVAGAITDEDGKPVLFNFVLKCRRLSQPEVDALRTAQQSVSAFLSEIAHDWEGVLDAEGAPVPYSAESIAGLLEQPGMSEVCFTSYITEISAVAKA